MIQWTPYIFVRFVFFLILGICTQIFWGVYQSFFLYTFIGLSILYLLFSLLIPANQRVRFSSVIGMLGLFLIFLFGIIQTYQFDRAHQKNHILYQDSIQAYTAIVSAEIQAKAKTYKTEIEIKQIKIQDKWQVGSGRIILYIRKDSISKKMIPLHYGDEILILGSPQKVNSPKNPYEFDYQTFLAYQNIYHQHFIKTIDYQYIRNITPNYFIYYSLELRRYCSQALKKLMASEREYAIAVALLLGVKEQMDDEISDAYANTGLMHVLAVSGMHVIFIVKILQIFLFWLRRLPQGKYWYAISIIILLWFYAFLTGLSASVLRAVVMFSFVAWGEAMGKRSLIYNNLAISAFILLIYNPFFILSVGFQLSYLAVLGIVYFQPIIYDWWELNNRFLNGIWKFTAVCLAAQLLTFPLGLYYFHQFPNYFLLANLLILTLSEGIMYVGLATLLLAWIPYLNFVLGQILRWGIWLMNQITFGVEKLPYSVSNGIYLSLLETYLIYAFIIFLVLLFQIRKFKYLIFSFLCIFLIIGIRVNHIYQQNQQQKLVIYNITKQSVLGIIQGKNIQLFLDSSLLKSSKSINYSIKPHWILLGIRREIYLDWEKQISKINSVTYYKSDSYSILVWQNKSFLILKKPLESAEILALQNTKFDYWIVQKNALRKLENISKQLKINYLIIDSSNGWYLSQRLLKEAQELKIPAYSVLEKGAWVLEQK